MSHDNTNAAHPVHTAARILNETGHTAEAGALRQYVDDQNAVIERLHRSPGAQVFTDEAARIMGIENATPEFVLQHLAASWREVPPVPPALHNICRVLAKHFADDPAVTFENAPGLVQHLIDELEETDHLRKYHAEHVAQLQEQEKQVGEQQIPASLLRKALEMADVATGIGAFGDGQPDDVLQALDQLVAKLHANQKPHGYEQAAQNLLDANSVAASTLDAIQHLINVARITLRK